MLRSLRRSLPLLVLLLAAVCARAATGAVSGIVTDPTGAVIPSATLVLTNRAQQTTYTVTTSKEGSYSFLNLPVGTYDLAITVPGFSARTVKNLAVDTDITLRFDVTL